MPSNIRSLQKRLRKRIVNRQVKDFKKIAVFLTKELYEMIVSSTPVHSGLAAGNWSIGINRPERRVLDRSTEGKRTPRKDVIVLANLTFVPRQELLADEFNILDEYTGRETLFISNNVEYINDLETGKSRQSPAGMVRVSLNVLKGLARSKGFSIRVT